MRIDHFRYFITINRLHSISAAAKFYNMNQNTLSTIVKQAEEEFGFQIFLRTPDGVVCTPQGEEFLKRAKAIDIGYSGILEIKKQVKGRASVSIMMDPVTCATTSLALTSLFYETGCRGNLRFAEDETELLIQSLGKEVAKIALVRVDGTTRSLLEKQAKAKGLTLERMAWDELCVMVSDQHPLASAESVCPSDLTAYKLVCHQAMEQEVCRVLGCEIKDFSELCCQNAHFCDAVTKRGRVAVISRLSAEKCTAGMEQEICILPMKDTLKENRQELVMAYFPEDMGKFRYHVMADCIRSYFSQPEKEDTQK